MTTTATDSAAGADSAAEASTDATTDSAASTATDDGLGDAGKAAIQAEREARKASDRRAKTMEAEIAKLREANMSADEKALASAKQEGRSEAAKDFGTRLAATQFDALAGRRNADFDTAAILDDLNLAKYVDENGDVKADELKAAVERLVPEATNAPPSFDRGHQQQAPKGANMNQIIRTAAGVQQQ